MYAGVDRLVVDQPDEATVSRVTDVIRRHIPEARLGRSHGKELNYTLPLDSVAQFAGNGVVVQSRRHTVSYSIATMCV